jgi:hypothetical protein
LLLAAALEIETPAARGSSTKMPALAMSTGGMPALEIPAARIPVARMPAARMSTVRMATARMSTVRMATVRMATVKMATVRMAIVRMLPLGRQTCVSKPRLKQHDRCACALTRLGYSLSRVNDPKDVFPTTDHQSPTILGPIAPFPHLEYDIPDQKGRIFFPVLYRFASLLVHWDSFYANGTQKLFRVDAVDMLAAPTDLLANIQRVMVKLGVLHQF